MCIYLYKEAYRHKKTCAFLLFLIIFMKLERLLY